MIHRHGQLNESYTGVSEKLKQLCTKCIVNEVRTSPLTVETTSGAGVPAGSAPVRAHAHATRASKTHRRLSISVYTRKHYTTTSPTTKIRLSLVWSLMDISHVHAKHYYKYLLLATEIDIKRKRTNYL